jgi:hypothetical protein
LWLPRRQAAQRIVITDVEIPLMTMVNLMVTAALAAIPAALIIACLFGVIAALLAGFSLAGLS